MRGSRNRFRVNEDKVLEALVFIANERPGIDVFHVCKVLYFADKKHINTYARPILGDTYFALPQGPVPTLAYDMIERDERNIYGIMLERLSDSLNYHKAASDDYLRIVARRTANMILFSESDIECLNFSINTYADMDARELWRIAHDEPAYVAIFRKDAKPSIIPYDLIIDKDNPKYSDILADLDEFSSFTML
jgi:uncharacterized phage-associated protein